MKNANEPKVAQTTKTTVKSVVTAGFKTVRNNEEGRLTMFNAIVKMCIGLNDTQRNAMLTSFKAEVKSNATHTLNEKKAVNNIVTTADNYLTLGLITARQHLAYSTIAEYTALVTKMKATKGDNITYKKDKDAQTVWVNKDSAIETVIATVTAIYSNDTFKSNINKDNNIAYNDVVSTTVNDFAKQYGKAIEDEVTVKSYLELFEEAEKEFFKVATDSDLIAQIAKMQLELSNRATRAEQAPLQEIA